ncbi:extracellular solute-binding protein [Paenibacillus sp. J5C_2022]|uniref:extracellular solute-binding protein n=1 Tax=Paenibacillus sp. J5C2022 TaxID=2977129 RepID=UPI0021CF3134|nr:extracellular solute-binding protein [Paenibacillus sp. J5C2022]MCU6708893.1 extracellular solute-binding protein [Paenibacillus sp. J5C2022]
MKSRWKSMLLAGMTLALLLSACSNAPANNGSEGGTPSASAPANKTTGEEPSSEDKKEHLTLEWFTFVKQATSNLPDASEDFVKQAIEEKFNVTLNMTYMPAGADYKNRLNLLLAGKDVPDMFYIDGRTSLEYIIQGLTADMTPFVSPETMPNYFKWVTQEELNRYQVEGVFERAPIPFSRKVYRSYYIRQDWLDNLGLDVPTSYEELTSVLKAFTTDDPDRNNKNDTYGFSASSGGTGLPYDFPQWYNNGLFHGSFVGKDDQVFHDNASDPLVGKIVDEVLEWIDAGIVDPDWFLNKGLANVDKAAQGKVGVVVGNTRDFAFDSNANSLQVRTKSVIPEAEWVPFNPIPDKPMWREGAPGSPFLFSKTVADNEPEKIKRTVEILDWLASEEGFLMAQYGLEGKHYTRDGNKITLNQEAYQKDVMDKGNFLDVYQFFTAGDPEVLGLEIIEPSMSDRDREIVATIASYLHDNHYKGVNVSPPAGFNLADFRAKMYEYQQKMIFDDKSGSNWPQYRKEIMTTYGGHENFQGYVEQIRAAGYEVKDFE